MSPRTTEHTATITFQVMDPRVATRDGVSVSRGSLFPDDPELETPYEIYVADHPKDGASIYLRTSTDLARLAVTDLVEALALGAAT